MSARRYFGQDLAQQQQAGLSALQSAFVLPLVPSAQATPIESATTAHNASHPFFMPDLRFDPGGQSPRSLRR
ncbi:MAG: hypothetical protein ABI968_11795 [Acidobacteriota bacterium]